MGGFSYPWQTVTPGAPPANFISRSDYATGLQNSASYGQSVQSAQSAAGMNAMGVGFGIMQIFGAVSSAIGTFYAAESQKNQIKMQAENQRFSSAMNLLNAKNAEFGAQQTMIAGHREIGRYTMAAGQRKSSAKAGMAARGIQAGVGSAAEVIASMDYIKEVDVLTMSSNSIRQAEAMRSQQINYLNQATIEGTSANNLLATAGTINPYMSGGTSLLGSATSIGASWLQSRRMDELLAAQSQRRF